jgi:hypothetical protein
MKTTLTFLAFITGSFAFAGGMAAGTNGDLMLLYGIVVGAIALFFGISRLLRFHKECIEEERRDVAMSDSEIQDRGV